MKVLVEAYGCALNRGEAGEFSDGLQEMGHGLAASPDDADAFAIFTCGVIETTERHMLRRIRELAREPEKPLLVCGCIPNICPGKIALAAPHAALFGPAGHREALDFLGGGGRISTASSRSALSILPIATGCTGSCTYCITKSARGQLRSRPPEEIRQRLEGLVARGAAEVQLCAQDTSAYGTDSGMSLGELIGSLQEVPGDFMLRIGMMNPANAAANLDGILEAYSGRKVFKFLHLPVQSGSDQVLLRMGRRHTVKGFIDTVGAFRERFPGLALSTDIIVGFPGETEEDFRRSMGLMERISPDIINVTRFSPRPGTEAIGMPKKVPGWKAKERSREMAALRFELTTDNYAKMKGRTVKALATERRVEGTTFLRTAEYRPVVVRTELELGQWYDVKVTGARRTHLSGKC